MHFDPSKFECITTKGQLNKLVMFLESARSFTYDTETTGLDVFKDTLVGHALAVELQDGYVYACYIPTGHTDKACAGFRQLDNVDVLAAISPFLEDATKPTIMQNALYDMGILHRYGVTIRNIHDTMLMSYALTAMYDMAGHGMDHLALKYLHHRTVKFSDVVIPALGHTNFSDVALDKATHYSAEDAAVTHVLAKVLQKYLVSQGLWRVYDEIDRPLLPALHAMKMRGVLVNVPKLESLKTEWSEVLEDARADMHRHAGFELNPSSPKQLAELLYGQLGFEVWATTKSGAPSTNKAVLETMEGEHAVIDAILDYREIAKLIGTYCDKLPEHVQPSTGRVHADTRVTSTRTGRLSMTDALHQIPTRARKGKPLRGRQIREAFEAPKGRVLVCSDYSQIEVRVLAHATQDPLLLKAFREGTDIHALVAKMMTGKDEPSKDERSAAKTITFGIIYGMTASALSRRLGVTLAEAEDFMDRYFDVMPTVSDWISGVHSFATRHGYVETLCGRRIRIPNTKSKRAGLYNRAMRQAVNYIIQGTAADLMRLAIGTVHRELLAGHHDADLLMSVHDELVVECDEAEAAAVCETVGVAMRAAGDEFISWSVPIKADADFGINWREAKGDE